MSTVSIWLLIVVSTGGSQRAESVQVIDRFPDVASCEHVRKAIPQANYSVGRCIQANVVR